MNYQDKPSPYELLHYGVGHDKGGHSGRYPWGSGEDSYQRAGDFLARIDKLKKEGFTYKDENGKVWSGETAIAKSMGLTTTQYRTQKSLAKDERRAVEVSRAKELRDQGLSPTQIARKMGYNSESSIRSLLNENSEVRMNQAKTVAEYIKSQVDKKGIIDIGAGVEKELGISKEKLKEAVHILELQGYPNYGGGVQQITNKGKQTNLKVICPPGTEHKDIFNFKDGELNIHSLKDYVSHDGGDTFDPVWVYPKSMDSKRLSIRYAEDGGTKMDGVIELRRGVQDLSLGESHYAQVRILVDGTHYLKGMAIYSDDLPDGVDVRFNTNKKAGTPVKDVLKGIKKNSDNPFGALLKTGINDPDDPASDKNGGQSYYYDKNGKKQLSLINKTREEGDWQEWSNKLSAQFLSKQSTSLIRKQLSLAAKDKQAEYDETCSLNNPTVKKALLKSFSDDCDSAAVHLYAAALPRQNYKVILPVKSMKDNEVYAPTYKNGEQLALIRYPHGGTFEIPILTVNNKQPKAKKMLGNALDAIGINSKVAERLSGADFDGDTVMCIPTGGKVKITSTPPLKGLEGFDPKMKYGTIAKKTGKYDDKGDEIIDYYNADGRKVRIMKATQTEMGKVSNLITDMTLKKASQEELAKAVRHSMVVIDAEKHKLDYKQSEIDNDIAALKKKYQGTIDKDGKYHEGASTLISLSKSETSVIKRKGSPIIDPKTGEQTWKTVDEPTYIDKKTGKTITKTQPSTRMAEAKDARELSSGTPQEELYADYANKMKSLANQARKEMLSTGKIPYSASAKKVYQKEVDSLMAKLNVSLKNAPRERQAQLMANVEVEAKKQDNPGMTKGEIKKAGQQALTKARAAVGAKRETIAITDKEWEAIQSGAVSESRLNQIINHTNIDDLRQRATPRTTTTLSVAKVNKIKAMSNSGYTIAEIAQSLRVSTSTVSKYMK